MNQARIVTMTLTPEEDLRSRLHLHLNQDGGNPSQLLEMLETMVKERIWESFGMTFREFVELPFEKHGLGWSMTGLKAVIYLQHRYEHRPEVGERMRELRWSLGKLAGGMLEPSETDKALTAQALEVNGKHTSYDNYHRTQQGTDSTYLTARIARDRPDILEGMKAGKYRSVRAAAIDAGIIDPDKAKRFQLPTDPAAAARYLRARVDEDWFASFVAEWAA